MSRVPTHPGELLRQDILPALGLTVTEFAQKLRVSRQTLHRLLSCRSDVSIDMALRLGKALGNGPQLWLGMQQARDLHIVQARIGHQIARITCLHTGEPDQ